MSYIYRHSNPEILKLGIRMALYDKPMPDKKDFLAFSSNRQYEVAVAKWREQSRIVYLKEPEFKENDIVYYKGVNDPIEYHTDIMAIDDDLSHYYPGQEWDGEIKYVREEETVISDDHIKAGSKSIHRTFKHWEWKEVEEPLLNHMSPGQDDTTQFQEDIEKAKILGVITLKKQ